MKSSQSGMKFLATAVTAVILFCGVGSMVIVGITALTVAPASRKADEARQASARVFSALAQTWTPEALQRTAQNPADSALAAAVKRADREAGTLLGAPRMRILRGPILEGKAENLVVSVRGTFTKREAVMEAAFTRYPGGPWKILSLGPPTEPEPLENAEPQEGSGPAEPAEDRKAGETAEAGPGRE